MGASSTWPSTDELDRVRKMVAEMSRREIGDVKVVVSPYRICPLGAHIDHQGGTVSAMAINRGVILGFVPSGDAQVSLCSGQFKGQVKFRVDETQCPKSKQCQEDPEWGCYAKGALYVLQRGGHDLTKGIVGYICGSGGLDSSGLSSSAAVGIAYLLALENANNLTISPEQNIELDRLIENGYLGLRNGILDQSAILLSKYGHLTVMDCKSKEYTLVYSSSLHSEGHKTYKILLGFSGLKHCLTTNPRYNNRVYECQEAARVLLHAPGDTKLEPILSDVDTSSYEAHKVELNKHNNEAGTSQSTQNTQSHMPWKDDTYSQVQGPEKRGRVCCMGKNPKPKKQKVSLSENQELRNRVKQVESLLTNVLLLIHNRFSGEDVNDIIQAARQVTDASSAPDHTHSLNPDTNEDIEDGED